MGKKQKTEVVSDVGKVPVFLAWSGPSSEKMAKVFHKYLPAMIQALDPFMSKEDISKGSRWPSDIAGKLESSQSGILCITPENLESRWLHFEAGAISKIVKESHVCPFLLGMSETDLKAPLSMYQATTFDKDELYKLVTTLNSLCAGLGLKERTLIMTFETYWPKIEKEFSDIANKLKQPQKAKVESSERTQSELLEELVIMGREQSRQLAGLARSFMPKKQPESETPYSGSVASRLRKMIEFELSKRGITVTAFYKRGSNSMISIVDKPIDDETVKFLSNIAKNNKYQIQFHWPLEPD